MGKWDFDIPTKSNNSFQLKGNTPLVKMTFDKVKEKRDIEFFVDHHHQAARRIVLSGLVWFFCLIENGKCFYIGVFFT